MMKWMKNNIANIITAARIVFSLLMLCVPSFSLLFWILYLTAGISDMVDGLVARMLHIQSEKGAKLDSAADLVFGAVLAVIAIWDITLPGWLWLVAAAVAAVKFLTCFIGYRKYRQFAFLHTYLNKLTGFLLFCFPILFRFFGIVCAGAVVGGISALAACEEFMITIKEQKLVRNRKCIFSVLKDLKKKE